MTYTPSPLDTSNIQLDDKFSELIELLAKNNHEVWARERLDQKWSYGPERNDKKKEHPCLIPYESLPESEKEYDRQIAIETLKVIQLLTQRML